MKTNVSFCIHIQRKSQKSQQIETLNVIHSVPCLLPSFTQDVSAMLLYLDMTTREIQITWNILHICRSTVNSKISRYITYC
jgi:hypothetical protein